MSIYHTCQVAMPYEDILLLSYYYTIENSEQFQKIYK